MIVKLDASRTYFGISGKANGNAWIAPRNIENFEEEQIRQNFELREMLRIGIRLVISADSLQNQKH